jgi:hypothetical protein
MSNVRRFRNSLAALIAVTAMLASVPACSAQTQGPSGPVTQNPAPTSGGGGGVPPGGCMYAGQGYSDGAKLPNGQTCKNGSWN